MRKYKNELIIKRDPKTCEEKMCLHYYFYSYLSDLRKKPVLPLHIRLNPS